MLISLFHENDLQKPTAISPTINSGPLIAGPTVKPIKPVIQQKQGRLVHSTSKQATKKLSSYSLRLLSRNVGFPSQPSA